MRIAVLADIHGNLRALEAVRADLAKRSPDVVVNLGDHVSGPLQATATADLLMQESYIQIRGNHDRQLIDRAPVDMGPSDQAAHTQLNSGHLTWLASLPATQMLGEDCLVDVGERCSPKPAAFGPVGQALSPANFCRGKPQFPVSSWVIGRDGVGRNDHRSPLRPLAPS